MKSNSSYRNQQNTVFQRQLLVKYGHILKKQVQRWYEINLKEQSIDYFLSRSANKIKGKIEFKQIVSINTQDLSLNQAAVIGEVRFQNCIKIILQNHKQIYLFQQDKLHLDQLINVLNMYKRGQKQQENKNLKAETFRYQEKIEYNGQKNNNNSESQEIQFVQVIPTEQSYYLQLMPESVSQRNIVINSQAIQDEEINNNNFKISESKEEESINKSSKKNKIEKNILELNSQNQRVVSQSLTKVESVALPTNRKQAISDQFEDQCLKFNDEITEVLSREETENTNRAQIFSKFQNLNDNFQIQKIKKQIHSSSNNLFKLTQESSQDFNIVKANYSNYNLNNIQQPLSTSNQDQFKYTTVPSPQSQFIKNPFSNPNPQSTTSFKQLPDIPLNTTTLGHSNIGNSYRFMTYVDSHRDNEQLINYPCQDQDISNILLNRETDQNAYSLIQQQEVKYQDEEEIPMHLSTTIRQRIENQCCNDAQEQSQSYQLSNDYQVRQSISEIQSESNLASIKQLNCEIKVKPFLKESITLELQNEFKKQSYFYQEFNTLLTLNTQYLGGSLNYTKTLNLNKRNSTQSFKNSRSQTLDQSAEKSAISQTPKQRDLFMQGSITSRTIAGNSVKQNFQQDNDSLKQFDHLIYPIQENYDGYSEDLCINTDKDLDQQSDFYENISQKNKIQNKNHPGFPEKQKHCPKKFPRSSNFNASFMRSEKRDSDSLISKLQKISGFSQEHENLKKQNQNSQMSQQNCQRTRLNQIPIEVYYQKKYQSDSNLLIDFGSDVAEVNQIFEEEDEEINPSNNMLAIQKGQQATKTKSDQDSQQCLSQRDQISNINQAYSLPQTPHKIENQNTMNSPRQQNLILNLNLPSLYQNQSTLNVHNSAIYPNTPIKSEYNVVFSPSRYLKSNNLDVQSTNNPSLDISKREQSLMSLKSQNVSKLGLDKTMKLVWDFQFTKASCVFEDFTNQDNVNMIIGQIYMLLIQFLISLKIDYAEKICKLCEKVIDIIINQRAKNNIYLSLVQESNLTEMYLIKGILQFSLDKKFQGLFSLKNAFKYYQKCQCSSPNLVNSLKKTHKLRLNLLEGLNNLAKSALQESFKKVLSFFGQTFDLEKGIKLLLKVSQADSNELQNNSSLRQNLYNTEKDQYNAQLFEDKKYQEYLKQSSGEDDISFTSHIATVVLSLYYIWREKNPNPIITLINQKIKQYPKSPIYYWISYLINFERKENLKAINDINKALSKAGSFSKSCLSFRFEKSLFLTSNLRWEEASSILGQIGVQLFCFEEFKFDEFKSMLSKAKMNTTYFSNFYRTCVIDYKPEKHFFIGISNLLLSKAACLIQENQIDFAKEWFLLSLYVKKYSYLNIFLSNDIHILSQLYLKRKNFTLVKYEIMYFTKTITKIPNLLIDQLVYDISEEEKSIKQKQKSLNSDQKELAVEQASCIFLSTLVGCLQFDDKMIEKAEQELEKLPKFISDSKYSDFSYLFHHSYYWICKFYFLQQKYEKATKNIKQMQKYSSKIFSLSQQAENIIKLIKSIEQEKQK